MATTTIEAQCNARPTRLAFIIDKPDHDQLNAVFARACSLWGGVFNPIVILDDSTRKTTGRHYQYAVDPYLQMQADLLKAFDPDLLIKYSEGDLPKELALWKHLCFPSSKLDWNPFGRNVQSYFVDIFPPLHDLWEKEFKGFDKPRFKVKFIEKAEAEKSLLIAARFGLYSSTDYYEFLKLNFKAELLVYDAAFRSSHWPADFQVMIGLTAHSCLPSRQRLHSHAFFLLNPDDPFDVVDYWNLRAAGMYIFPLTMDTYQECAVPIENFAAASAYPINQTVTNMPSIIKAASITDEQLDEVANWIGKQGLLKSLSRQGWVPHYGNRGYGVGGELEVDQVRGTEGNAVGVLVDGHGKLEGPVPPFLTRDDYSEHWSMDLDFFTFRTPDACYDMPWLNSGCDALIGRRIGMGFGMDVARIANSGIVARLDGNSGDIRIGPIKAEDVVQGFLDGASVQYKETSSPGLALHRIIEMVGGFYNCEVFRNSAIRDTLDEMANGDSRLATEVWAKIMKSLRNYTYFGQPTNQEQKATRRNRLLEEAIESGVFRVGLVFQCTRCRRHHWYAITEFDTHYNCKSCFSRESTPRLDVLPWHYASDGLFRSANKLDGNITIILTLMFFNQLFDHDLKFAPSFNYSLDGSDHEMDFAIIAKERFKGIVEMVFGESKSGMSLSEDERNKLKVFGQRSGSYLCFCTLAADFGDDDKKYFMELYEGDIKIIMLPSFFLEMDDGALSQFKHDNRQAFGSTSLDWLMRVTIIRTLGKEFADKHHIWA
ncbi:MAG: hypothetical protein WAN09_09850 [Candidatus Korobacteraceae bacterium]